jgi:predicted nuclease of predicted toxin-antitoxin system
VKLYLDESVSIVLANVLAQHGVDCLTVREAGHLGQPDEFQLSVAAREHRVFFTHDTRDFSRLASNWTVTGRTHAGILLAHQLPFRELILRFRAFLLRGPSLDYTNQILWLPPVLEEK